MIRWKRCGTSRCTRGTRLPAASLFSGANSFGIIEKSAVCDADARRETRGGITECRRIAALAETKQMPIAPHSPAGPVSTMAGVHVAATVSNFTLLEYAFGEVSWREDLLSRRGCRAGVYRRAGCSRIGH